MTFTIYKKTEELKESHHAKPRYLPNVDTLPVVLMPSILGCEEELFPLAEKIYELSGKKRAVYLYNDDRNILPATHPDICRPLRTQGERAADEIIAVFQSELKHKTSTTPFLLAASSYNAAVSMEVANTITKKFPHVELMLYIIDGVTPKCAESYFANNSPQANENIIEVVNYACKKSGYFNLLPSKLAALIQDKPLADKISFLGEEAEKLNYSSKSQNDRFNTFIATIKNDLTELSSPSNADIELDNSVSLKLLTTHQTVSRYNDPTLGWPDRHKKVLENAMSEVSHTQLLAEENVSLIAKSIRHATREIEKKEINRCMFLAYLSDPEEMNEDFSSDQNGEYSIDETLPVYSSSTASSPIEESLLDLQLLSSPEEISESLFETSSIENKAASSTESDSDTDCPQHDDDEAMQRDVPHRISHISLFNARHLSTAPIPVPNVIPRATN